MNKYTKNKNYLKIPYIQIFYNLFKSTHELFYFLTCSKKVFSSIYIKATNKIFSTISVQFYSYNFYFLISKTSSNIY